MLFSYVRHDYPRALRVRLATREVRRTYPELPPAEHARLGDIWVAIEAAYRATEAAR